MPKLAEWVYGSAIAWGCTVPYFGADDLLRGSGACCDGTIVMACTGLYCTSGTQCQCNGAEWDDGADCVETLQTCPAECDQYATRCTKGPMNSCYYPT